MPSNGVWIVVLVLGQTFLKKFSNSGLLFVVLGCGGLVPVVAVPVSGVPVGMWLFAGL